MKLISHRGLVDGPSVYENSPSLIEDTLSLGFDCEIDVWKVHNQIYLGHDEPKYIVKESFILSHTINSWYHCKNYEILEWMSHRRDINYFWHEEDDFTLTSRGFIWTYPSNPLCSNSVCVLPEKYMRLEDTPSLTSYGICSDYIKLIKEML